MYNFYPIIVSSLLLFLIDSVYLYLFRNYFNLQIRSIQGTDITVRIISMLLCYVILVGGLNYFILYKKKSVWDAFLLGLLVYGVYETTNYAIFRKWTLKTVIIDTLWGGILFAFTTFLMKNLFP